MTIVSGRIYVRRGSKEEFLTLSREAVAQARRSSGYRDFLVAADPIEEDRVNVYEEWETAEDLRGFRGEGPGRDLSSSIVRADVSEHTVTSSEPA